MRHLLSSSLPRRTLLSAGAATAAAGLVCADDLEQIADPQDSACVPVPPLPDHGLLFSCKYGMTRGPSLELRLAAAREAGMDGVDFDAAASVTPPQLRAASCATGVFIHNAINHDHWKQTLTNPDEMVRATGRANLEHSLRCSHAAGGSAVLIVVGKADDGPDGPSRARDEIQRVLPLAASLGQVH